MDERTNERDIIARAQAGDKGAISDLYKAYSDPIFQYISYRVESSTVAEDLTGEVFLRMVRGLTTYEDRGLPFGAWLFRIAANLVNEHYRQHKQMRVSTLTEDERSNDTDPFERLAQQEEREQLLKALHALPAEYQDILILRFMRNLSHTEVAAILAKSETAVRALQHRALKALGEKLGSTDKPRSYHRGKRS
ncbi:MAG: sigma-70 family RNA polymerase sigma factor [Anaerolinea sp.]